MDKVILIGGHAQAGKDTTAIFLRSVIQQFGKPVLITHYADLLKYICQAYFDWDGVKDDKGRSLLQYVGTDLIRKKDPDFWVDIMCKFLDFFGDRWDYVVIPDVRFPNEVDKIKERFDASFLRIVRPGYDNGLSKEQKSHASETAMDEYIADYTIVNNATKQDLYWKAQQYYTNSILRFSAEVK